MSELKQTLQRLGRTPGFTLAVILTIALGAGVNTAIFGLVDSILLRPLQFRDPDRLVRVRGTVPERGIVPWVSPPDLEDISALPDAFKRVGGIRMDSLTMSRGGSAAMRITTAFVTPGFLPTLGVAPVAGRSFDDADFHDRPATGLMSESVAQRLFGDPSGAVGASVAIDGNPITIAGVLPNRADVVGRGAEIWLPLVTDEGRGSHSLIAIGRLADGVGIDRARTALDVLAARLATAWPETNAGRGLAVTPLQESIVTDHRKLLLMLQLAAIAVLLIASANAGALVFARFASRQRELAIRGSLGASRRRLVGSLLAELTILGVAGGVAGFALGSWTMTAIVALSPFDLPRRAEIHIDPAVFVMAVASAVAATLVAGIGPALRLTGRRGSLVLREGIGAIGPPRGGRLGREVAVAATIALSVALVGSAAALARNLSHLLATDTGFVRRQIATFDVSLPENGWEESERRADYYARMIERLKALPGAARAGAISILPFGGGNLCADVAIAGASLQPDCSELRFVSRDLFSTLGIPLVEGRGFERTDTRESRPVAIVNRAFARRFVRVGVGRELEWHDRKWTIVGVTDDVRTIGFDHDPGQQVYLSIDQVTPPFMAFAVRSAPEGAVRLEDVRRVAESVDDTVVIDDLSTIDGVLNRSVAAPRFRSVVLASLASLALVLTMIGLYGTLAVLVRERGPEIALRRALGASPADVVSLVLSRGGRIAAGGVGAGLVLLTIANGILGSWLFGVSALEWPTLATTIGLLFSAAAAACLVPVHRAIRVNPATVLKGRS